MEAYFHPPNQVQEGTIYPSIKGKPEHIIIICTSYIYTHARLFYDQNGSLSFSTSNRSFIVISS
eukprot:CAMPEP_0184438542 /NCGR_PEP_ID=MMETSP0738-20130409/657255_1 /TAXON_ID=385413 /ORGANISM="Thalassiosira miniscula, Strain CCMP1093" /LENGTH=63 /DNA_ID=CAMNT_0026805901 /DNA_START=183 /DNA_END=371 /DNA_ORIENTATION=+